MTIKNVSNKTEVDSIQLSKKPRQDPDFNDQLREGKEIDTKEVMQVGYLPVVANFFHQIGIREIINALASTKREIDPLFLDALLL